MGINNSFNFRKGLKEAEATVRKTKTGQYYDLYKFSLVKKREKTSNTFPTYEFI